MGDRIAALEVKLARTWVPPHTKVVNGKAVQVDGYWRTKGTGLDALWASIRSGSVERGNPVSPKALVEGDVVEMPDGGQGKVEIVDRETGVAQVRVDGVVAPVSDKVKVVGSADDEHDVPVRYTKAGDAWNVTASDTGETFGQVRKSGPRWQYMVDERFHAAWKASSPHTSDRDLRKWWVAGYDRREAADRLMEAVERIMSGTMGGGS